MSYYFTIVGTKDNPLFEYEFGTHKSGGDGVSRFRDEARHMNQFIVHSSLDMVEEVQWLQNDLSVWFARTKVVQVLTQTRFLKTIDRFQNNHIFCFLTGGNVKFLLLMNPDPNVTSYGSYMPPTATKGTGASGTRQAGSITNNPTSTQTEEAVKSFMGEVYELWIKHIMNPLHVADRAVSSPAFRANVAASAKKYL